MKHFGIKCFFRELQTSYSKGFSIQHIQQQFVIWMLETYGTARQKVTVCTVLAPLCFSSCCGFRDMLQNHSWNDPQDISEVHPSIKGGDIWPKMISMKQQDPLESHDLPYLRMQFRFAVLSSTSVRFPNVETEVGNVLLCKSSLVPCFFGML